MNNPRLLDSIQLLENWPLVLMNSWIPYSKSFSQHCSCEDVCFMSQGLGARQALSYQGSSRAPQEPCKNCQALCIAAWDEADLPFSDTEGNRDSCIWETGK